MQKRTDRKSISEKTIKRILRAAKLYLSDYRLTIKQVAQIISEYEDFPISEKTLRENLFVHSIFIDESLYTDIHNREYKKCEYILEAYGHCGNIRSTAKQLDMPKSTIYDYITKRVQKYPELNSKYIK